MDVSETLKVTDYLILASTTNKTLSAGVCTTGLWWVLFTYTYNVWCYNNLHKSASVTIPSFF